MVQKIDVSRLFDFHPSSDQLYAARKWRDGNPDANEAIDGLIALALSKANTSALDYFKMQKGIRVGSSTDAMPSFVKYSR